MGVVWTITAKDLRQRLRDRSVVLIAVVVPLGLTVLFNLLFGSFTEGGLGTVRLGVVDDDRGPVGAAYTDEYLPAVTDGLGDSGTTLEVTTLDTREQARGAVEAGELDAAWIVPAGTTAAVREGRAAPLEVVTSADAAFDGDVAQAIAEQFLQRLKGQQAAFAVAGRLGLQGQEALEFAAAAGSVSSRVGLDGTSAEQRQLDTGSYLAAGMAVFFLFFTVQFGVLGYLEEQRDGTLPRLLVAPIHRWQVLAAKGLVSLVVGVVAVGVLLAAAVPLLGASWGDPVGVALLVVTAVLTATALVTVVAAISTTAEQANVWQSIIAIVLGMLGGAFFPVATQPGLLADLSLLTPHAQFLRGLGTLHGGGSVVDVVPAAAAMAVFAVVVAAGGGVLSRVVRR